MNSQTFEVAIKAYKAGLRIKPMTGDEDERWYHINDPNPLLLKKLSYLDDIWEIENE